MRAGEDDRMDVRIAVHPINQFFQISGDLLIKGGQHAPTIHAEITTSSATRGQLCIGVTRSSVINARLSA